ncbi:UDP-N-acetylmuramate--alanine ligase [Salinibacter ruber]|nr:UDP-N-acetylmuramate--L-alanine ligase [Salinibacter ruber]MCS3695659.1 UDP-N-acetylmuramate--alanine ligase [Salinibacter ruber]MCS3705820.1 UDP-N-acetylmuramate--alanine ligase [Salinibacter ruber]MCS4049167.1 UDP-N-acetylmuramate--alanine ligase [Salinibacter ruber]MCS4177431.1 UDP-N-acetylmuramate--alanine ligase [Salinibacter ruber]
MAELRTQPALGRIRQVHMVGIGGIGMSSIAEVLLNRGYTVTGSDLERSDVTERLEAEGATIHEGHAAEQVGTADVVVYSSAVDPDENPETREAERRRISLIPRAEMLGELIRMKFGVGVAGTHGKTTTTSMAGLVVAEGGFDPTVIVGGKVTAFGSNAITGEGDVLVIEADEYDRTFLRLTPSLAVITSIEEDHLDVYEDLAAIQAAFTQYANSVPFFGAAILCLDDPNVQAIVGDVERRVVTYGTTRQAEVRGENVRREGMTTRFDVVVRGERLGTIELHVPGMHNVRNALAAVAVGQELEISFERVRDGLGTFTGVRRRFEKKGEVGGITVLDDYAHHPTEIEATLDAAHQGFPDRRVVAVFQPHMYSRTQNFMDEFARSFFNADMLVLTDVYGAREAPIEGVTGGRLAERAEQFGHRAVHYVPEKTDLPGRLQELVGPGDVVLMLGAGDIWRASEAFVELLENNGGTAIERD